MQSKLLQLIKISVLILIICLDRNFITNFISQENWVYILTIKVILYILVIIFIFRSIKTLSGIAVLNVKQKFITIMLILGFVTYLSFGILNSVQDISKGYISYYGNCEVRNQKSMYLFSSNYIYVNNEELHIKGVDYLNLETQNTIKGKYLCKYSVNITYLKNTGTVLKISYYE
jgi:hypothetical protein